MAILMPVRYIPKEQIIVDQNHLTICIPYERRGENYLQVDARGKEIEDALNHVCEPIKQTVGEAVGEAVNSAIDKTGDVLQNVIKRGRGRPRKVIA